MKVALPTLKVQKRELLEAINAGKTALHTVNEVLETLDNAEGWSTWDVMGGGLMADLAKYEELDNAQEQVEQLQVELRRFKTELADVEITADLRLRWTAFEIADSSLTASLQTGQFWITSIRHRAV